MGVEPRHPSATALRRGLDLRVIASARESRIRRPSRHWVAPNRPYGAIISYYLDEALPAGERAELAILDAGGRLVRVLEGTGRAGVNRVVWNLREPACGGRALAAPGGRGRRAGESWIRALPGTYRVRLAVRGRTLEQPFEVWLDPRVTATREDLEVWYREVKRIEGIECGVAEALETIDGLMRRIDAAASARGEDAALAGARRELASLAAKLGGDPRHPDHDNLRAKIDWLTIQVGNYTGRPTVAQMEWIARFERQLADWLADLERIRRGLPAVAGEAAERRGSLR